MDNATRKFLLQRHKQSGFPGSILDVFQAYNQGIDIIGQFEQQNNMQVAQTPQQQQQGLRPAHQAGNISQSMIFPNVPPNTPFNTVGMKAPINIEKYDEQGHLVKSYENVPPGVQNLPTGPQRGTVIETPANMQDGGELTFKQRVGNIKRDINSELLDGASWRAQSDARDAARDGIQGEGDSYRHILGSAYSVNALRRKGFGPITSMIAANALGLGHELTADSNNTLRESFEDITNNFAGSVLGLFNNDAQAKETARKMVPYLPDGLPQEYGDRRYEGFQGQYQAGGVQDNTRVSMPTLSSVIPLDTSALRTPPDQGTIRQAGRAAPPNAMAFMPPGLQYNQMAAGKYIEENPLSNPVSLTAMGAFEALSPLAFGASAPTRSRQAINLSKDVMPESMQITKLQNQATRAVRGMRQADLDLIGDANRALRRGAAEHNLFNRRTVDRASDLFYEAARERAMFNKNKNTLLRNIQNLYRTPSVGGRTLRPGEAPNRYTLSALDDLTDRFTNNTMSGLNLNQAGGPRKYQSAGQRRVLTMGLPDKVDILGDVEDPAAYSDALGADFNTAWNNSAMARQMATKSMEQDLRSNWGLLGMGADVENDAAQLLTDRNENIATTSFKPTHNPGQFAQLYGSDPNANGIGGVGAFFSGYPELFGYPIPVGEKFIAYNPEYNQPGNQLAPYQKAWMLGVGAHERSHAADLGGYYIPSSDKAMMERMAAYDVKNNLVGESSDAFRKYVQEPTETRARLMAIRSALASQGVDVLNSPVSEKDFNRYIVKGIYDKDTIGIKNQRGVRLPSDAFQQLNKTYSKDNIFNMLNTISYEDPGELPQQNVAKRGGKRPTRKYFKLRK